MSHNKHKVCIKVPKVYDWVVRQVELPLISINDESLDDLFDLDDLTPPEDLCDFLENFPGFTVDAKLQKDSLHIQEISQPHGRHDVPVTLPNGETITLQKVKVLVKGLLDVIIFDCKGNVILSSDEAVPFATAQTFFLCAPKGTKLDAHISYFQADADIVCTDNFEQLDISVIFCLEVQMEAKVKLEVEAAICQPREELPIEDIVCPTDRFPPQCPEIFPGNGNGC